jgi:hypothetical protein
MKPVHMLREKPQIARDLRTLRRRLKDRMIATRIAIAFLKEAHAGKPILLPTGI